MRKWKELSKIEQQEIIEKAKKEGIYPTYNYCKSVGIKVYPDTLKYQINQEYRQTIKTKENNHYHTVGKFDENKKQRDKKYRKQRQESGIAREKWLEWWDSLTPEQQEQRKQSIKQHRLDNLDHYKQKCKDNYQEYMNNTTLEERRVLRNKNYTEEKKREYYDKCKERYNTDPVFKLKCLIRMHINRAVSYGKTKKYSSKEYLGCSVDEFRQYIESQFKPGMTWENHGRGLDKWHLDHILPLSSIKSVNDEDVLKTLCNYKNYQPLWESDNLSKSTKIVYPFNYTDNELKKEYKTISNLTSKYFNRMEFNKNILHFQQHFYEKEIDLLNSNPEIFNNVLENRKKYLNSEHITIPQLIRGLKISGIYYGFSHFSYRVMKQFIQDYKPTTIYDPCGGWGHRLLASGDLPYIYNDLWGKSVEGVNNMIKFHNLQHKTVYNEDCRFFSPNEQYDTVFTCPPYYNTEIYNDHPYNTLEEYYEFLTLLIDKSVRNSVHTFGMVINETYGDKVSQLLRNKGFEVNVIKLEKQIHHFSRSNQAFSSEILLVGTK